jgi:putative FmdB family regulatory protein
MPIYEYRCAQCGEKFELFVRSAAQQAAVPTCPKCGSAETRKALSLFGIGEASRSSSTGDSSSCGSAPT